MYTHTPHTHIRMCYKCTHTVENMCQVCVLISVLSIAAQRLLNGRTSTTFATLLGNWA